jgi:hypothetical protein
MNGFVWSDWIVVYLNIGRENSSCEYIVPNASLHKAVKKVKASRVTRRRGSHIF